MGELRKDENDYAVSSHFVNLTGPGSDEVEHRPVHTPAGAGDAGGGEVVKDSRVAWLVCFAAFLIQVLIVGVLHVIGVFFVQFLKEFECTKGDAGNSVSTGVNLKT